MEIPMEEPYWYGVAEPREIAQLTGKQILKAIIDGNLPHPPISQTLTFWLVEIGDGFAAFEGDPAPICSIRWGPCMAAGP
jgi:hypothetical protein